MKFELVTITHKFKLRVVEVSLLTMSDLKKKKFGEDFYAMVLNEITLHCYRINTTRRWHNRGTT